MNTAFVDTSGIYALLINSDREHDRAEAGFARLRARQAALVTTSYVLAETYSLLGRRHGSDAMAGFRLDLAPMLHCTWVDESLHEAGLDYLLRQQRRRLSFVDSVSIEFMRRHRIEEAFAFDADFDREGFTFPA